jgi:exodeoxyribonuclease VII small subunit
MPPTEPPPLRFEQALAELEAILRELEDGTTSLEDSLARYERGVGLLRHCYGQLRDAEQKVKLLAGLTEDGGADLKPFEHVPSIESAKAAVRKTAKSTRDSGIPE